MKLNFDLNHSVEKTEIVLGKKNYDKFGSVINVTDLTYDYNLMSAKSISFVVHKTLNKLDERLWNQIRDRRLVWIKEYDEWFEINVNINEENEITKEVTGITLCEAELGQINVNSTEINTDKDIERSDYKNPTVFYKPSEPKESLLHRILKKAPNYSIDHVDSSLWNIQRTFSFDGSTIYDVLTGEIAEEIGCLFLFNSSKRSISVYDLQTNCLECGHRGTFTDVCPECSGTNLDYGYGYDTSILIDSENLAQNITLTGKQDEVKNYIKVCGGDDVINTAISACNPSGLQYIFAFSKEDKEDMSDELSSKLDEYLKEYDRLTPTYKEIMLNVYNKINEQLELESNMMPDIEQAETNAELELSKLTKANLSPVAVQDVSVASIYTVNNAIIGMAKCVVNSTVYKIEIIDGSSSYKNQKWKGKFRLENKSDEEDFSENTGYVEIDINDDYAYFIEQKIQKTIDRDDIYLVDIFDVKTDLNVFTEELKKYSLNRLESFESAYESVLEVMREAEVGNDSIYGDIYNDLYLPYYNKLIAIQKEMKVRGSELETVTKELEELDKSRVEITSHLNFENYLGEELWKELCSFRREDTYENSNYVSDGLDDPEILKKAQELLDKARDELITSSTTQWTLSATLYNLLAMPEFSNLTDMFEGGNWIRIKIDDKIYRLRLVHYRISDNDIQNLEVEFSDVTQTANGLNDVSSLMSKVQSMATNFSAVTHQAEQGEKSFTELDKIRNDSLNLSLYNITNSVNQDFIIDKHGITGRMWDDIRGTFAPEQFKMNHNLLVFTDDYWKTAKSAWGKIEYYNPLLKTYIKQYGLIVETVVSGNLIGNDIIGGHVWSENYSSTTGTHIDLNNGDFSFAGGKLSYDSETNELNVTGKITCKALDYSEIEEELKESLGITKVEKDIEDFNNSSVLTPLEKQDMLDDWDVIQEEYKKNIELAKVFKVEDNDITKTYTSAYNTVVTEIVKCGLDDLSTTTTIDTRIYNDIKNYHLANVDLANLINEKSKELSEKALSDAEYYSDTKLDTFVTNDYKKFVDNIQKQVDGKSETYYQSSQPYENHLNVADNAEYNKLVGDLWYDSDESAKKTYVYRKTANGSNFNYQWTEMEVPTEIFDLADGKAKIFTSKPSNYSVNDLWLVANDYIPSISGVKIGYVLVSTKNNSEYTESDWALSIKYTDDSALTKFINGTYTTKINYLEEQEDKKAETWYQATDPVGSAEWTANGKTNANHKGDIWYNTSDQKTYIYDGSAWNLTTTTPPDDVFDKIDGKAQIFIGQPKVPYRVGDLWFDSDTSDIMTCIKDRLEGNFTPGDWEKRNKYTDDSALNSFIEGEYSNTLESIGEQIDKKAETWYQSVDPAKNWNTDEVKKLHIGDLWYNTSENKNYVYSSSYEWNEIDGVPDEIYDKLDTKAQIFVTQPTPPYNVGDLWVQGVNGDIYKCSTARENGSYVESDWTKASKYTDDSALTTFIKGDYADDLDDINKQIDKKAETWYQETDPSTNWTTTDAKSAHIGDLWFNTKSKKSYIYSSSYVWQEADGVPDSVYDEIDGKAQIFSSQPTTPYYVGDLYVQGSHGDIYVCQKERLTGDYASSDWKKASKYTDDSTLNTWLTETYATDKSTLQSQIDGKIETFFQANDPSKDWSTTEKSNHSGDLWYDTANQKSYIWSGTKWDEIKTDVPDSIYDSIDSKKQIFTSTPTVPYYKGDLWVQGSTGDILYCNVTRESGSYTSSEWSIASKYTDDTTANNALNVANTAISDSTLTPSEKRDLLNEINNIKSLYAKYSVMCNALSVSYDTYTSVYNTLINASIGETSVFKLDVSETTTLTSTQVVNFKKYFQNYYSEESAIIKAIQDATNENVKDAKDAADEAQKDANEALDLLTAIASDDTITPVEKLQLKEKYDEITSSYNKLLEKYKENKYGEKLEFKSLKSAYGTLIELFNIILTDMDETYKFSSGNHTRDDYLTYIKNYYEAYQAFINYINTELETNISTVHGLVDEAKELGVELKKCLGFAPEFDFENGYVISPYIGGGYLDISVDNKGRVAIDPLGISPNYTGYIFGVYNKSNKLVMGVDTNGNGVFEGKVTTNNITATSGYIGKWSILTGGGLMAETDTGTEPGTLNRMYLQPFNNTDYENTWVISSQYKEIGSDGTIPNTSKAYWYITGEGYFYTTSSIYTTQNITVKKSIDVAENITVTGNVVANGYIQTPIIYANKHIQTPMIYTDGATIKGKTSIYNEGLELYHQTPYIDFHFGYTDGATAGDHTARIVENSKGALTVYNSISNASDRRLKQDISDLDKKYLNALNLFKPVSYRFIKGSDNLYLGFIAQDIEKALIDSGIEDLPLVSQNSNGIYALDYNQITALNTLGHLDHEKRIKQLEEDLNKANATIQELLNKLNK